MRSRAFTVAAVASAIGCTLLSTSGPDLLLRAVGVDNAAATATLLSRHVTLPRRTAAGDHGVAVRAPAQRPPLLHAAHPNSTATVDAATPLPALVDAAPSAVGASASGRAIPAALPPTVAAVPTTTTSRVLPPDPQGFAPPRGCTGAPLTNQAQVRANTAYCGGTATTQILLAPGDTWTDGEVTGVSTGPSRGAVECPSNCSLVNMNVHDNPSAFAGINVQYGLKTSVTITGGRVTGSGVLGIGGGGVTGLTISGVEIDHNGARADCNFEGGGFKAGDAHTLHFFNNYVHDNACTGVWLDINSSGNEIDHNRVVNNDVGGIFYEISQDASIHDNTVTGNGFKANGTTCVWLWGAGIGIASSFNIQVFGNTLSGNCNGIDGTQQNRTEFAPPAHLLKDLQVHDNSITSSGTTGAVADTGADLTTRGIVFSNNSFAGGARTCGLRC